MVNDFELSFAFVILVGTALIGGIGIGTALNDHYAVDETIARKLEERTRYLNDPENLDHYYEGDGNYVIRHNILGKETSCFELDVNGDGIKDRIIVYKKGAIERTFYANGKELEHSSYTGPIYNRIRSGTLEDKALQAFRKK